MSVGAYISYGPNGTRTLSFDVLGAILKGVSILTSRIKPIQTHYHSVSLCQFLIISHFSPSSNNCQPNVNYVSVVLNNCSYLSRFHQHCSHEKALCNHMLGHLKSRVTVVITLKVTVHIINYFNIKEYLQARCIWILNILVYREVGCLAEIKYLNCS